MKHNRISEHPAATPEFLEQMREAREENDRYYLSPEGQAELHKMKEQAETRHHGGARAGAGRKSVENPKVTLSLRVTEEVKKFLESTGNASEATELTIRRSSAFKKWCCEVHEE